MKSTYLLDVRKCRTLLDILTGDDFTKGKVEGQLNPLRMSQKLYVEFIVDETLGKSLGGGVPGVTG